MKYEVLTVKIPTEVSEDLEAFAAQEFPVDCPKCSGSGALSSGAVCTKCNGKIVIGNRSEAARFLLHFALGQKVSPEMRAMLAAYSEIRSKFIGVILDTAHRMEAGFRQDVLKVIKSMQRVGR